MGYNGIKVFDIESPVTEFKFSLSEEEKIEKLIEKGIM